MSWVRIHDGAMRHHKILDLTDRAFRVWVEGLSHVQEQLTDGLIRRAALRTFGYVVTKKSIQQLVESGLWQVQGSDFFIHDYTEWNDSREVVERKRSQGRQRVADYRKRQTASMSNGSGNGVTYDARTPHSPSGVGTDTNLDRASAFCHRYRWTIFPKYRRGAAYIPTAIVEHKDLESAERLCGSYTDEQLDELAAFFLQIPDERDPFLKGKTRTITMLLSKASAISERMGAA
jgi:hypothetical protein